MLNGNEPMLTGPEKAAILLSLVGEEIAANLVATLGEEEMKLLRQGIHRMANIEKTHVDRISNFSVKRSVGSPSWRTSSRKKAQQSRNTPANGHSP